jgi:hypothetical protein
MALKGMTISLVKGKGKVRKWGLFGTSTVSAFCTLTPKEFHHSSLEALHAERRQRPQLAKEGTMNGILLAIQ